MTPGWTHVESLGPRALVFALAAAASFALLVAPAAAIALMLAVFAAVALPRVRPQHVLVAAVVYLPFENQALTYAPEGWAPFIRYAPEALIDLAVILVVMGNLERVWTGLGQVRWPLALSSLAGSLPSSGRGSRRRRFPLAFAASCVFCLFCSSPCSLEGQIGTRACTVALSDRRAGRGCDHRAPGVRRRTG